MQKPQIMKTLDLNVFFDKVTLNKSMGYVKTNVLYALPNSNLTDTSNTLNFVQTSRLSFGHVEAVLYFAKKFNLFCSFLSSKERKKFPFFIDLAHSIKMGHNSRSSLPDWEYFSPIVTETYSSIIISPVVTTQMSDGCIFNALSVTVSSLLK